MAALKVGGMQKMLTSVDGCGALLVAIAPAGEPVAESVLAVPKANAPCVFCSHASKGWAQSASLSQAWIAELVGQPLPGSPSKQNVSSTSRQ